MAGEVLSEQMEQGIQAGGVVQLAECWLACMSFGFSLPHNISVVVHPVISAEERIGKGTGSSRSVRRTCDTDSISKQASRSSMAVF